jgi:hypothetical protein
VALNIDLIELLREFDDAEVRYLLIGGYALGFHGAPRVRSAAGFPFHPGAPPLIATTRQTFGTCRQMNAHVAVE